MEEKALQLSGKESRILRDVCFAGMEVLHAGDPEKHSKNIGRQILTVS